MKTARVYLSASEWIDVKNAKSVNYGDTFLVIFGEGGRIAEFTTIDICGYRWLEEEQL